MPHKHKVLFAGPEDSPLLAWLRGQGEIVVQTADPLAPEFIDANGFTFLVSYGYRHILRRAILEKFPDRAVNLHISYLPWNRGADPNLWSFLEDSPKGVTIHYLDEGVDTGDIIAQEQVAFDAAHDTLATSYAKLHDRIQQLFRRHWAEIADGTCRRTGQTGRGTSHRLRDRQALSALLSAGWDTPVSDLIRHGKLHMANGNARKDHHAEAGPLETTNQDFQIGGRAIGAAYPAYIIAEMSANHNHDLNEALRIVRAAKDAGADAIKLQTYTPDTMTLDLNSELFQVGDGTLWKGRNLYDLYREAHTPWEWHADLKRAANDLGLDLFSTPFDDTAVDLLEQIGVPAYKIASFEVVDLALIRRVAATGKPMIVSTGMATLEEIGDAVAAAREAGAARIALLKCTSAYPAPPEEMNLRTIPDLAERFGVVSGLSDHTMGIPVPVAAVALGARIIEKHFTISRSVTGPDSAFSLEPHEFKAMVDAIRTTEKALGHVQYEVTQRESASKVFRRSLFVVADMAAGQPFTPESVRAIRPGFGLAPKHLAEIMGRRAACAIQRGTPLRWELIATE